MSYILEKPRIDLDDTAIENIFITEFMPSAQGTYVKVYLLAYQYAKNKNTHKFTHESVAKILNMPLTDVLEAWDYWEKKGVIKKETYGPRRSEFDVEFINLKQLFIENLITPKQANTSNLEVTIDDEQLFKEKQIPEFNTLLTELGKRLRRPLTPNESKNILEWIHQYNVTCNMILRAVDLAENQKQHIRLNYVGGILRNWYDHGITNEVLLDEFLKTNNANYYTYYKIMNGLGLSRNPIESEKKKMIKWLNDWKFNLDIILMACNENIKIDKPNIPYTDAILEDWYKKSLFTQDSVSQYLKERESKNSSKKKNKSRNDKNFDQKYKNISNDELEKRFIKNL
jgi:DnaD/phage-associated family protein